MTVLHVAAFLSAVLGVASGAYGYVCARRAARDRAAIEMAETRMKWRTEDMERQWRKASETKRAMREAR